MHITIISSFGYCYLWEFEKFQKGITPKIIIKNEKIKYGRFSKENENELILGVGSNVNPVFKKIIYLDDKKSIKNKIKTNFDKEEEESTKEKNNEKKNKIVLLNQINMEDPNARFESNFDKKKKNEKKTNEDENINGIDKEDVDDEEDFNKKIMKKKIIKNNKEEVNFTITLNNALKFDDDNIINECLKQTDIEIVNSTVKDIDSSLSIILLEKLLDRYQKQELNSNNLILWIKSVLLLHTNFIIQQKNIVNILSPLYLSINNRLNTFSSLLDLSGRLDLLLSLSGKKSIGFDKNNDEDNDLVDEKEEEEEKIIEEKINNKNFEKVNLNDYDDFNNNEDNFDEDDDDLLNDIMDE
jgi:hypothetical protein